VLAPNSTIAVIATGAIPRLDALAQSMELARSWGYRLVEGPHLRDRHFVTAGTAEARSADLAWALTAPDIDAVWLARGGYGSVHTLPTLSLDGLDGRPILGYSDATALFCALDRSGYRGLVHGPLLEKLATDVDAASQEHLRALLAGEHVAPLAGRHQCGPTAPVRGRLVGGNLSVLASLAGTPWALSTRDAILVLEDVDEPAYALDRMLTQLRCSGALDGVVGVALGEFVRCTVPKDATFSIADVLQHLLEPLGVPVIADLPIGHGHRNLAWRYGHPAMLVDGTLSAAAH